MSRGPGKWQRAILDALDGRERVVLRALLPEGYKQADLSALYRAADTLRRAGLVWRVRGWRQYEAVELRGDRPPQVWAGDKGR